MIVPEQNPITLQRMAGEIADFAQKMARDFPGALVNVCCVQGPNALTTGSMAPWDALAVLGGAWRAGIGVRPGQVPL